MLHVDLSELAGGQLQEKFDREITRVIQNMQDPNTPYGDSRKITITVSFKQTEMRDDAKVDISVSSKLASVISAKTYFALGKDLKTGEVLVSEYGRQIPGQMSIADIADEDEETESSEAKFPRVLKAK